MSLNANAKASAQKLSIRVLDDPKSESRTWLNDVSRKAKLIGAIHSVKMEWYPIDEVDTTLDDDAIVTQSSDYGQSGVGVGAAPLAQPMSKQRPSPSTPMEKKSVE